MAWPSPVSRRWLGMFHPGVKGIPRARWLTALGVEDPLVTWWTPTTWPAWLAREAWAALPEAFRRREGRDPIRTPGFQIRQIMLVTTLLDAASDRVAALAEWYRQRWQLATSLAHLKTTMPRDGLPGKPVPAVGPARTQRLTSCHSALGQFW
jgi:hypothetical protein